MRPIVYWIDPDDAIVRVNAAWTQFAIENDAPELTPDRVVSASLWACMGGDAATKGLYAALLERVRAGAEATFPFRCDSPGLRRYLEMVVKQDGGLVRFESQLLRSESRPGQRILQRGIPRGDRWLKICSWCKRVEASGGWLDMEAALAQLTPFADEAMPGLTHGLCPACADSMHEAIERLR
jgi:hypothetical protein